MNSKDVKQKDKQVKVSYDKKQVANNKTNELTEFYNRIVKLANVHGYAVDSKHLKQIADKYPSNIADVILINEYENMGLKQFSYKHGNRQGYIAKL